VSTSWIPQWNKIVSPKPHAVTETGYYNCPTCFGNGLSERASGKYYSRLWFEYFNRGIWRTNAYELIDQGVSRSNREMNWGLLRHDGSPKPQFTATKNIIALLSDPGPSFAPGQLAYTLSNASSATHRTLLQKRDGRFYLALWQTVSVWNIKSDADISTPRIVPSPSRSHPRRHCGSTARSRARGRSSRQAGPAHYRPGARRGRHRRD
jgi:hypothetical protein